MNVTHFDLTHIFQRCAIKRLLAECDTIDRIDAPAGTKYIVTVEGQPFLGVVLGETEIQWTYGYGSTRFHFVNLFDAICMYAECTNE